MAPIETATQPPPTRMSPLTLFALKAVIGSLCFIVSVVVVTLFVSAVITDSLTAATQAFRDQTKLGGREFWAKMDTELDRLADPQALSPEKKREIIGKIKAVSSQWRPFLTEAYEAAKAPAEPEKK